MTSRTGSTGHRGRGEPKPEDAWLLAVAEAAAASAGAPVELLGEYLTFLADAAVSGRRPQKRELEAVRELGRRAAEQGVGAAQAVDLYLSAAWRLWRELPMVVRSRDRDKVRAAAEAVLRVIDDAVEVLVDGYQAGRRQMVRHEESLRRDFIDDLLRGDADVSRMVERAEPFGLDLGRAHQVALTAPIDSAEALHRAAIVLERVIVDRFGDRDVLVGTKDSRLVVLVPGMQPESTSAAGTPDVVALIQAELGRLANGPRRRVAAGRAHPGAYGIPRSYEEAREALTLAERLDLDTDAMHANDLLVYRVLGRDQAAIADLVRAVLDPLTHARGGAEPLLHTLQTYFATGEIATETARRMNMSVRTVTYRLAKVKDLTGQDAGDPAQKFTLHAAVLGARLLDWPAHELPASG
ncbi:MAG: PucR family transcriptional regulator [Pseudonocardiales bacterium]|nr:MAG: PucR family transcriptional regulator [Pseudonocardiales bacterium]